MKIKKHDLDRLILTLQDISDSLKEGEEYLFTNSSLGFNIENYVLPKKWCIRAETKENAEILYPFQNECKGTTGGWSHHVVSHLSLYFTYDNGMANNSHIKLDDFEEITIEQFKKYVLKNE